MDFMDHGARQGPNLFELDWTVKRNEELNHSWTNCNVGIVVVTWGGESSIDMNA